VELTARVPDGMPASPMDPAPSQTGLDLIRGGEWEGELDRAVGVESAGYEPEARRRV
jgi:hypothetical protein